MESERIRTPEFHNSRSPWNLAPGHHGVQQVGILENYLCRSKQENEHSKTDVAELLASTQTWKTIGRTSTACWTEAVGWSGLNRCSTLSIARRTRRIGLMTRRPGSWNSGRGCTWAETWTWPSTKEKSVTTIQLCLPTYIFVHRWRPDFMCNPGQEVICGGREFLVLRNQYFQYSHWYRLWTAIHCVSKTAHVGQTIKDSILPYRIRTWGWALINDRQRIFNYMRVM